MAIFSITQGTQVLSPGESHLDLMLAFLSHCVQSLASSCTILYFALGRSWGGRTWKKVGNFKFTEIVKMGALNKKEILRSGKFKKSSWAHIGAVQLYISPPIYERNLSPKCLLACKLFFFFIHWLNLWSPSGQTWRQNNDNCHSP